MKKMFELLTIAEKIKNNKTALNSFIQSIMYSNIMKAIEWCERNNIEVDPYYTCSWRPDLVQYNKDIPLSYIEYIFPPFKSVNHKRLIISYEGSYSLLSHSQATFIAKKIADKTNNLIGKVETMIDCMGRLGQFSVIFSKYFKNILVYENNDILQAVIKNNLREYSLERIKLFKTNFMDLESKAIKCIEKSQLLFFNLGKCEKAVKIITDLIEFSLKHSNIMKKKLIVFKIPLSNIYSIDKLYKIKNIKIEIDIYDIFKLVIINLK